MCYAKKMRRALWVILGLFFFLLLFQRVTFAAYCDNFSVEVNGSYVTVSIEKCTTEGKYLIQIQNGNGAVVAATEIWTHNKEGSTTFHLTAGNYSAVLFYNYDYLADRSFTVFASDPLRCGSRCNPNDEGCPEECPAVYVSEEGQWYCQASDMTPTDESPVEQCDSNGNGVNNGILTALGCIPIKDATQFVAWLLARAIGIGGGIAFLLMIFGAIKVLTSAGNPENVKAGKELITSALMGLLFIIFSLFLLELIGVKILNIPGFGKPEGWSGGGSGPEGGGGGGGGGGFQ